MIINQENNILVGTVTRTYKDVVLFCRGPVSYTLLPVDLKLAIDSYGFLIEKEETITSIEWIRRIRKTYAKCVRRQQLCKAIIIASYTDAPKRIKKEQ